MNVPKFQVNVDQARARELGFTQPDVANSLLVLLSGSGQVQPNCWVDLPKRFALGAALNVPDPNTFYGAGPGGYTDYPTREDKVSADAKRLAN